MRGNRWEAWIYPALGAGIALASMLLWRFGSPIGGLDIDQTWEAGRALLAGRDPYALIGADPNWPFPWPYFYPLTAAIIGLPLTLLSFQAARIAFTVAGGALLGHALGRSRPWAWPIVFSAPFLMASRNTQWSLLFTAALLLPWLGVLASAKPNLGIVLIAGARSWRTVAIIVGSGAVLLVASLAWQPHWVVEWRTKLATVEHFTPLITRPGAFLVCLAALRWRDPDARVLLALVLIPQTGLFYESLPALLVSRSRNETASLSLLSLVGYFAASSFLAPGATFADMNRMTGTSVVWSVLIPATALVLARGRLAVRVRGLEPDQGASAPRRGHEGNR